MKAIIWTAYGPPDVLQPGFVDKPVPATNEVLIRIHASTVTGGDCETRSLRLPLGLWLPMRIYMGLVRPKRVTILGAELAGVIEAVGQDVTRFTVGDRVVASTATRFGAYAEYASLPENYVMARIPDSISFEEAATLPIGGLNALHFIRKANLSAGQTIAIYGASGSIGTYAIQLARQFGAEVSAVGNPHSLDVMKSLGADYVMDYTKKDFPRAGKVYDALFDVVGKCPWATAMRALKSDGTYLLGNPQWPLLVRGLWTSKTSGRKVIHQLLNEKSEDLVYLMKLLEAGTLDVVIDKSYPLEQVAEAHRYVEHGNKTGNVVITISPVPSSP